MYFEIFLLETLLLVNPSLLKLMFKLLILFFGKFINNLGLNSSSLGFVSLNKFLVTVLSVSVFLVFDQKVELVFNEQPNIKIKNKIKFIH